MLTRDLFGVEGRWSMVEELYAASQHDTNISQLHTSRRKTYSFILIDDGNTKDITFRGSHSF